MALPNFLVVGAPRAGTTTIYWALKRHPEVFMSPNKEPWFFAVEGEPLFQGPGDTQGVRDFAEYQALFEGAPAKPAIGEASTLYLYSAGAPRRIAERLPDVKVIAVLRQPAERAYSQFQQHLVQEREPLRDFAAALRAESERIQAGWAPFWYYRTFGYYAPQLKRYFATFGKDRVKVLLYDDLKQDAAGVFRSTFEFLGLDPEVRITVSDKENVSGLPRIESVNAFLVKPGAVKSVLKRLIPDELRHRLVARVMNWNLVPQQIPPEIKRAMTADYRSDILETSQLIGRDLSHWLDV